MADTEPTTAAALPAPECELGYPAGQLAAILGSRKRAFDLWMRGQTAAICDGRSYNHGKREYQPTGCGPHGMVVYRWDVEPAQTAERRTWLRATVAIACRRRAPCSVTGSRRHPRHHRRDDDRDRARYSGDAALSGDVASVLGCRGVARPEREDVAGLVAPRLARAESV